MWRRSIRLACRLELVVVGGRSHNSILTVAERHLEVVIRFCKAIYSNSENNLFNQKIENIIQRKWTSKSLLMQKNEEDKK
tara:strand:+ start:350 stop:589 length:240 start_codon:yes stop_codon:yes gene_type:complete